VEHHTSVLITRSEPGASALARELTAAGYRAVVVPFVRIEECRFSAVNGAFDVVVFTSVHAVESAFGALASACRAGGVRVIAVGAATRAALAARGVNAGVPASETSEGILGLPELAAPAGRRVLIVGGVGGRRLLDAALHAGGARVTRLEVYRRVTAQPHEVSGAIASEAWHAVIVSSAVGGEVLDAAVRSVAVPENVRRGIYEVPIVVPSERVANVMRDRGFRRVIESKGAAPAAVVTALQSIEEARHGG
jgi:uroporphyrinogen-III synthase